MTENDKESVQTESHFSQLMQALLDNAGWNSVVEEDRLTIAQRPEYEADQSIDAAMALAECAPPMSELIDIAWVEAHRILGSQRARILAGFTKEPDPGEIQRAARMLAVVNFLELCEEHPERPLSWVQKRRRYYVLGSAPFPDE